MLRLAVLVLLLANAGYYAWCHGQLQSLGLGPSSESEPQRLQQQIEPQNLHLLPSGEKGADTDAATARATGAATDAAHACLQAGLFDARQAEALRQAAARLPAGSWSLEAVQMTGRWMVYLGRLADEEAVARKRAELRALKVDYDRPGAALEPGLSLGRYSTEEGARRALDQLAAQGVRRARVVQERSDTAGYTLRLPAVSESQREQVEASLRPALAGKALRPCT
ncbi:MAG: SPOR domain-containing protein [Proteobacteria bacterium]|nr:SPOR domain-containing protein [Pseudomonadota bacterium]